MKRTVFLSMAVAVAVVAGLAACSSRPDWTSTTVKSTFLSIPFEKKLLASGLVVDPNFQNNKTVTSTAGKQAQGVTDTFAPAGCAAAVEYGFDASEKSSVDTYFLSKSFQEVNADTSAASPDASYYIRVFPNSDVAAKYMSAAISKRKACASVTATTTSALGHIAILTAITSDNSDKKFSDRVTAQPSGGQPDITNSSTWIRDRNTIFIVATKGSADNGKKAADAITKAIDATLKQ